MTTETVSETTPQGGESTETRIERILNAFVPADGVYKREEIDEAIALKDRIIPRLLEILKDVLRDPDKYKGNEDELRMDHVYALMLLGHFREPAAHRLIVDLFSLPGNLPYDLFGDTGSEDLPLMLVNTCGGSLELIRSLVLDRQVDLYSRGSALQAMEYAAVEGLLSIEEVQAFLGSLFAGDEGEEDPDFWGFLAIVINELHPAENIDILRKAFEDGLIPPYMIRYENIEDTLEKSRKECIDMIKSKMGRHSLDDIHDAMSWWACFNEDEDLDDRVGAPGPDQWNRKIKKAKKKKQKQAKASKKKNRRK